MGYEIQMIVATRSSLVHDVALVDDRVVSVYHEPDGRIIYFPSPNTEADLPEGSKEKKGSWFQHVAIVELCKNNLPDWVCSFEESNGEHLYEPFDGNELLGLDNYGKYRKAIPIDTVIEELKKRTDGSKEPYRRYVIALALLVSVKEQFPTEEMCCFFYGH